MSLDVLHDDRRLMQAKVSRKKQSRKRGSWGGGTTMSAGGLLRSRGAWDDAVTAVVLGITGLLLLAVPTTAEAQGWCPTGFANFGDSLTDTGNAQNAFPYTGDAENRPYGETFFGKPSNRFCNGRVLPDFFSLAFRKPLLDAYFAPASFNYRYGVNFAAAGATARPDPTAIVPFSVTPYQTAQFIRLKSELGARAESSSALDGKMAALLPVGDPYPDWLYTLEAGGNDLLNALQGNMPFETIESSVIPQALGNISVAVHALYKQSARRFLLFNVPAQGCSTILLTRLRDLHLPTDSMGCLVPINGLMSVFNAGLNQTVQRLRRELPDATISFFDYYSANLEILQQPARYGFHPNLTFTACCGAPGVGTLNYNPSITCGHPKLGASKCANPNEYVIWDGVHFTESFYRTIAEFALSAKFTEKGVNYTASCDLDFSKFGPEVTFRQAYP